MNSSHILPNHISERTSIWLNRTISEIAFEEGLSTRTVNVLGNNSIETIFGALREFLNNHKSLRHFPKAGDKVTSEIAILWLKAQLEFGLTEYVILHLLPVQVQSIPIQDVGLTKEASTQAEEFLSTKISIALSKGVVSQRLTTILLANNITTIRAALKEYIEHNYSFKHLPGAGDKVNSEIAELRQKAKLIYGIDDAELSDLENTQWELNGDTISKSDPLKLALIRVGLPDSIHNSILTLWEEYDSNLERFSILTASHNFSAKSLLGGSFNPKEENRIAEFLKMIALVWIEGLNPINISKQKCLRFLIHRYPRALSAGLEMFTANEKDNLKILKCTTEIIRLAKILSDRQIEIVSDYYLGTRTPKYSSLNECSERFGLTRERVRQMTNNFVSKASLVAKELFNNDDFLLSQTSLSRLFEFDCVVLSESLFDGIQRIEGGKMTDDFIGSFLVEFLVDSHVEIRKGTHPTAKPILIAKQILEMVRFERLSTDIQQVSETKIGKGLPFNLDDTMGIYCKCSPKSPYWERTRKALETILTHHFGLKQSSLDNYLIKLPSLSTRLANATAIMLSKSKEPLALEEIHSRIILQPEYAETTLETLRNSIIRSKKLFAIGKSGYYTTFREQKKAKVPGPWMTYEELALLRIKEKKKPLHISEILEFINRYTTTTRVNLLATLNGIKGSGIKQLPGYFFSMDGTTIKSPKTYSSVPAYLHTVVKKIISSSPPNEGIEIEDLIVQLGNKHNLSRSQVNEWLQKRATFGKLILEGSKVYLPQE